MKLDITQGKLLMHMRPPFFNILSLDLWPADPSPPKM